MTHPKPWAELGISEGWYNRVRNARVTPSPTLALRIYDLTGEQVGILRDLSNEEIEKVRKNVDAR